MPHHEESDQDIYEGFKKSATEKNHHLPEDILFRIIVARDYNYEKAESLLEKYVNAKKSHPELFVPPTSHGEDILRRVATVLPHNVRTLDGFRCAFSLGTNWDPDFYNLESMIQALVYVLEAHDLDRDLQKDGYVHLVDAANLAWKHVKAIRPSLVISSSSLIAYELPIHLKQIIVYNANWMVDVIWKICKPLLPSELVKLITIINHNHSEKLLKFLPQEVVEQKLYVPTNETITSHVEFLMENRTKVATMWNTVFNEEIV